MHKDFSLFSVHKESHFQCGLFQLQTSTTTRFLHNLLRLLGLGGWRQSWPTQCSTSLSLHSRIKRSFKDYTIARNHLCWKDTSPASEATDSFDVLLDNDIPTGAFLLVPSSNKSSLALSIALKTFLSEGVAPSILRKTCSNILLSLCNQCFPLYK